MRRITDASVVWAAASLLVAVGTTFAQAARNPTDPIEFDSHGGGPHRVHILAGAGDVVFAYTDTSHDQQGCRV